MAEQADLAAIDTLTSFTLQGWFKTHGEYCHRRRKRKTQCCFIISREAVEIERDLNSLGKQMGNKGI